MTDDAAVQTPATDEVVENEPTQRELLEQAYDKMQTGEGDAETPEEFAQELEAEEAERPEEPPQEIETPTDLPGGVKQHWKDIPEPAREAVLKSQREMSAKLSQATRETQGLGPIRDVMIRAAREVPGVKDMRPAEIAEQMWGLIQAGQQLQKDPEKAFLGLAKQHNIDLAKLAGGEGQASQDAETIRGLQAQLEQTNKMLRQVSDPNYMRAQLQQFHTENTLTERVNQFATERPHWTAVESEMPRFIAAVNQIMPDATPDQVLQEAYDMAVHRLVPNAQTQPKGAGDEPAPQAPERVKAAVKAKSVNVRSEPNGKSKPGTQREAMEAVWDRMNTD